MHSFNNCLLSFYYVRGPRDKSANQSKDPCPHSMWGETGNTQNEFNNDRIHQEGIGRKEENKARARDRMLEAGWDVK